MQGIDQSGGGTGNVAVQISGDGNSVTLSCRDAVLQLQDKHSQRRIPRSDLDLLRPDTRLLDLIGREAEIASLLAWLDDPRPVLARGITGRAGSGKTRLAIELCEKAGAAGWRAGFLDSGDLQAFVEAQRTAVWPCTERMLIVVDYAARRARTLNTWLHSFVRRNETARPQLRLLLLERHATPGEGWWGDLQQLEGNDDRLYDACDPLEPVPLPPLTVTEQRRSLMAGIMTVWCERNGKPLLAPPPAGRDPQFDCRLADPQLAAEPLFLMMAGLVAARHGLDTLLSLGRLDLAFELACWERDRLVRFARERAVNDSLLLHLVACITLCRGIGRNALHTLIGEERAALPYEQCVERDALARAIVAVLPTQAIPDQPGGLGGLEPDIIGETFCLLILATNQDLDQRALIGRCLGRAPARMAQTLALTPSRTSPARSRNWLGEAPCLAVRKGLRWQDGWGKETRRSSGSTGASLGPALPET